jgi:hypothetical protein
MEIRTSFPRFQEYFTLIVQFKGQPEGHKTTGKMYVGRYFTEKGEFDEVRIEGILYRCVLMVPSEWLESGTCSRSMSKAVKD